MAKHRADQKAKQDLPDPENQMSLDSGAGGLRQVIDFKDPDVPGSDEEFSPGDGAAATGMHGTGGSGGMSSGTGRYNGPAGTNNPGGEKETSGS